MVTNYILDALIALSLTQSLGVSYSPERPTLKPAPEISVWHGYAGLYKFQTTVEKCARIGMPSCPKPKLTWASGLHDTKQVTTNKETKNVSR